MKALTIRGLDGELLSAMRKAASARGVSMNRFVLDVLKASLNASAGKRRHGDLDSLAGSWTASEAAEFDAVTAKFESIDEGMWQ